MTYVATGQLVTVSFQGISILQHAPLPPYPAVGANKWSAILDRETVRFGDVLCA